MKKLLFITISILLLTSCKKEEKELISLEGTRWKFFKYYEDGGWGQKELTFTDTHVTYLGTTHDNCSSTFTGVYTFDPPTVVIVSDHWIYFGDQPNVTVEMTNHHQGTVSGRTMTIGIQFSDVVAITDFLRQ